MEEIQTECEKLFPPTKVKEFYMKNVDEFFVVKNSLTS